jgi:hypothetical protein
MIVFFGVVLSISALENYKASVNIFMHTQDISTLESYSSIPTAN